MPVRLSVVLAIAFFVAACSDAPDSISDLPNDVAPPVPVDDEGTGGDGEGGVDTDDGGADPNSSSDEDKLAVFRGLNQFTVDTTPAVLEGVTDVLRATDYVEQINALYELERSILDGSHTLVEVAPAEGEGFTRAHSCEEGGRYLATPGDEDGWNGRFSFEICIVNGVFRNGTYSVQSASTDAVGGTQSGSVVVAIDSLGLGVSELGVSVVSLFGSTAQEQVSSNATAVFTHHFDGVQHNEIVFTPGAVAPSLAGLLTIGQPGVIQTATEYTIPALIYTQTVDPEGLRSRQLRISQESTILTTEPDLTVVVSQDSNELALVSDSLTGVFDAGTLQLSVSGAGGNRLRLRADNADPDTFNITIGADGGAVVSEVLSWTDFSPMLFLAPDRLKALDELIGR